MISSVHFWDTNFWVPNAPLQAQAWACVPLFTGALMARTPPLGACWSVPCDLSCALEEGRLPQWGVTVECTVVVRCATAAALALPPQEIQYQ